MVAGALGTVVASITLSYAKDIIRGIGGLAKDASYDGGYKTATIILATIMMWCLDFAINTGLSLESTEMIQANIPQSKLRFELS